MILAIISDIHDNIANLDKCLDWCRNHEVKKIVFCGDATTLETLDHLAQNFSGEIFSISGNIEYYSELDLTQYKNIIPYREIGLREIGGLNIGFCHEPKKINKILKLASTVPDLIFYGHTHKPWLENDGDTIIANPGNVAGIFYPATFAALNTETKKLDLIPLADLK